MENELAAWEGSVTVGKTHPTYEDHHRNDHHSCDDYNHMIVMIMNHDDDENITWSNW